MITAVVCLKIYTHVEHLNFTKIHTHFNIIITLYIQSRFNNAGTKYYGFPEYHRAIYRYSVVLVFDV